VLPSYNESSGLVALAQILDQLRKTPLLAVAQTILYPVAESNVFEMTDLPVCWVETSLFG
jgi:hypothetical protein